VYATSWASHARHVKGNDPDEKGYPGPPGLGGRVRLTTSARKETKKENRGGKAHQGL